MINTSAIIMVSAASIQAVGKKYLGSRLNGKYLTKSELNSKICHTNSRDVRSNNSLVHRNTNFSRELLKIYHFLVIDEVFNCLKYFFRNFLDS